MSNAKKRNALAWALIAAPVLFFDVSLMMGKACPGAQMFWALMLLTHMPFVALPFWAVFHGHRRTGIFLGWLMFLLGEIAFNAFYFTYYKMYGWPRPGLPGGILVGLIFGWGIGWLIVTVAEEVKQMADNHWPIRRLG
jgi:hypothetical protein